MSVRTLTHDKFRSTRGSDLRNSLQPGISEHNETTDTGWCITRYACLLPQLSPGTHSSLTTEGGLRLSRPRCLVLRRGGLPVQRRSPTLHWPGLA